MTFDELWRRNVCHKNEVTTHTDALEELDEHEVNRFLEWLEASLLPEDLA